LDIRADSNRKADPFGQTPLMVAAAARNLRCCEALLEAGACVTDEDNEAGKEKLSCQSRDCFW